MIEFQRYTNSDGKPAATVTAIGEGAIKAVEDALYVVATDRQSVGWRRRRSIRKMIERGFDGRQSLRFRQINSHNARKRGGEL